MDDISSEIVKLIGYDAIPRQRYMSRIHEISGLSFSSIGRLMKHYDRRLIAAAVLCAKNNHKSDNLAYVISILDRMNYFIDARKE